MRMSLSFTAFTRYDDLGASSRIRFIQYSNKLKSAGYKVNIQPLISNKMLAEKYKKGKYSLLLLLLAYFKRITYILLCKDNCLWIEKELFPWLPFCFERIFLHNKKFIVDFDDAVFHQYDQSLSSIIRFIYSDKHYKIMHSAKSVTVGSRYLKKVALLYAKHDSVVLIPSCCSSSQCPNIGIAPKNNSIPVVVWIGSPTTLKYLIDVIPALEKLSKNIPFILRVIGAKITSNTLMCENIEWSPVTEHKSLSSSTIGIMPLRKSDWELGKCSFKLIQYMSCGLPSVSSPIGENLFVITPYANGLFADTLEEWYEALRYLLLNQEEALRMGTQGFKDYSNNYSLSFGFDLISENINYLLASKN